MRTTVLLFVLALLVPAAALSQLSGQNGTLSIREGRGVVELDARGSMTGRANGKITITDPRPYDAKRPVVYGATKTTYRNVKTTVYQGKNLRFRLIGARFQLRIQGQKIYLSAIARGTGSLDGAGDPSADVYYDGVWSLNDSQYQSLPDTLSTFDLSPPAPQ